MDTGDKMEIRRKTRKGGVRMDIWRIFEYLGNL